MKYDLPISALLVSFGMAVLGTNTAFAQATVVRQPGPYPDSQNAWYSNVYSPYEIQTERLIVGGWGDEYDTFIRFDLGGLPKRAISAKINLWALQDPSRYTTTNMVFSRVTEPWQTRTLSLTVTPGTAPLSTLTAPSTNEYWYSIDVTSLYNEWRKGTAANPNYGVKLTPVSINNSFSFFASANHPNASIRPQLVVTYDPNAYDDRIRLKWPLGTLPQTVIGTFNTRVDATSTICPNADNYNAGTDFAAAAGSKVHAADDGMVREVTRIYDKNAQLVGFGVVLEHSALNGTPYTTVYRHVQPVGDVHDFFREDAKIPRFVPKGTVLGKVYDLGASSYFHFGVRYGAYEPAWSGLESTPGAGCIDGGINYPGFPARFFDPMDNTVVLFE